MSDTFSNTQKFRTLNVIDDFNGEALLIKPSFSLPASNVIKHLYNLAQIKGYAKSIITDNGPLSLFLIILKPGPSKTT